MSELTREQAIDRVDNRVSLAWTDLSGINLSGADLSGADLSWTNLSEALLRKVDLRWANLRGANLSNADLSDADFFSVNFLNAKGITRLSLAKDDAIIHKSTAYKNPSGIRVIIGCENHTLEYWQENHIKIGKGNGYSRYSLEDIESYKSVVEEALLDLPHG